MGTDIHVFVERRADSNAPWEYLPRPNDGYSYKNEGGKPSYRYALDNYKRGYETYGDDELEKYMSTWFNDRNYELFARLADVRNGTGFAGVKTGDRVRPIALPKGWPLDLSKELFEERDCIEHSPTWFTLHELIEAFDALKGEKITRVGYVSGYDYQNLMENDIKPESWSGGISGATIVTCSPGQYSRIKNKTHVDNVGLFPADKKSTQAKGIHIPRACFSSPGASYPWRTPPYNPDAIYSIYVQATWESPAYDSYQRWTEFLKELSTYTNNPENLRVLIYFDS